MHLPSLGPNAKGLFPVTGDKGTERSPSTNHVLGSAKVELELSLPWHLGSSALSFYHWVPPCIIWTGFLRSVSRI